jgi:ribose transport system permease protein
MSMKPLAAHRITPTSGLPSSMRAKIGDYGWIWIGVAVLLAVSALIAPGSVTPSALRAMLPFAAILAVVAVGQTLVIQQRGIDMSAVGSLTLAGILVATWGFADRPLWIAIPATLAVVSAIGAINGLLVTRVNIAPIVTTLAVNALIIGAVRQISKGAPLTAPALLRDFATARVYGLPYLIIVAIAFIAVVASVMNYTAVGRRFVAVGVSPLAAEAAGIVAERYQVGAYAFAAFSFSIAGILLSGFIGNAAQNAGADYLLPGVAAVVVGGTPLTGGRGSVVASAVAALFITQLGQMVLSMGATPAAQLLVQALAIVVATGIRLLPEVMGSLRRK